MEIGKVFYSNDKVTRKYVQKTDDNLKIETTFVDYKNKFIICFSTQIGCNLGCKFCYNGIKHNFKRNLTDKEICEQIENVIHSENINNSKPLLFSAMGIGEPLLNYENLIAAFHYLDKKYPNSKFALATSGVDLDKILKLANDMKDIAKFKLTISLHSAFQEKRNFLMPVNSNINKLVATVKEYKAKSGRDVEWNYILVKDVNDTDEDAKALFKLLGNTENVKINKFNNVENSTLRESEKVDSFISQLTNYGMQVEYYQTNGSDINGACGQMISD